MSTTNTAHLKPPNSNPSCWAQIGMSVSNLDLVLDVTGELERQILGVRLASERREDLTDSMKLLSRRASQKPHKVAIVGRTEREVNPPQCPSAASTPTYFWQKISYCDGPDITARILYKSLAQWKMLPKELDFLVADALEGTVSSEESTEASHLSPSYQAREKLCQIYPHLRDLNVEVWDVDSLLADPTVNVYLGKDPTISASHHGDFGKKLEQCLSSCGDQAIWPLVQRFFLHNPLDPLILMFPAKRAYQGGISGAIDRNHARRLAWPWRC
ncbi:hypothetical protein B0H10DRAFT_1949039 [Mycena sp. CBHHK59/15]|nr:hypothetical protein B0H10DRAFT_1949039 [Mycena sp. CBHHK59/15]